METRSTPFAAMMRLAPAFAASVALSGIGKNAAAQQFNGFEISNAEIPSAQILRGGPPRDGIPAIDRPRFVPNRDATELDGDDRVLGLVLYGEARAYPVAIMNWHEIVNDEFGGHAVAVTYCPLCGSGVAYRAEVAGRRLRFGVSGLLYNSDVLLYDRQTESLWSQIASRAISGPMRGTELAMLALEHTRWSDWRARHPRGRVLSRDTGFARDYSRDPYRSYRTQPGTMFPVHGSDARHSAKTWVFGLRIGDDARAYPFPELDRVPGGQVDDIVGGRQVRILFDRAHRSARAIDAEGVPLAGISAYWFAWMAFHPGSTVFDAGTHGSR
ncbi:MAG: DUF3179 domain-containing protein [Rhodocyclaceae bacterium]|nr:DUF3179 domain-containing protein [Rhodocyclaceae bacterium]